MKLRIFRSGAVIAGALSLVSCFPSLPPENDVSVEDVVATDDSTPANDATEDVDGPSDARSETTSSDVDDTASSPDTESPCDGTDCACRQDGDCDDGDLCNGVERCVAGSCAGGVAPDPCPPGTNACLASACDPATGQCVQTAVEGPCDDGNACTRTDVCRQGECVGEEAVECLASAPCTEPGVCNPATGVCSTPTLSANDTACETSPGVAGRCDGGTCRPYAQVSAGFSHTCVLTADGDLACFGSNEFGQLGYGSLEPGLNVGDGVGPSVRQAGYVLRGDLSEVTAGTDGTCVRTTSLGVKCWGVNQYRNNGISGSDSRSPPSTPLALPDGFDEVVAISRAGHACVTSSTGRMLCWGGPNYEGSLGNGTSTPPRTVPTLLDAVESPPVALAPFESASKIATGGERFVWTGRGPETIGVSCAVVVPRGVVCWGLNVHGQLGVGDTDLRGGASDTIPALVPAAWPTSGSGVSQNEISSMCVGWDHVCAIQDGVGLRCWGNNATGQLGRTDVDAIGKSDVPLDHPPLELGQGRTPKSVGCGRGFTCVLSHGGEIVCFGNNTDGRLGAGRSTEELPNTRNVDVASLASLALGGDGHGLAVGDRHACAVMTSGAVKCWGFNGSGRLGVGHTRNIGSSQEDMPPAAVQFQ